MRALSRRPDLDYFNAGGRKRRSHLSPSRQFGP